MVIGDKGVFFVYTPRISENSLMIWPCRSFLGKTNRSGCCICVPILYHGTTLCRLVYSLQKTVWFYWKLKYFRYPTITKMTFININFHTHEVNMYVIDHQLIYLCFLRNMMWVFYLMNLHFVCDFSLSLAALVKSYHILDCKKCFF